MRNSLLRDAFSDLLLLVNLSTVVGPDNLQIMFVHGKRVGVHRGLKLFEQGPPGS